MQFLFLGQVDVWVSVNVYRFSNFEMSGLKKVMSFYFLVKHFSGMFFSLAKLLESFMYKNDF